MHPTKASGPDGLSALFYQASWDVIGPDVVSLVQQIFNSTTFPDKFNHMLLSLVPKKSICEFPSDYRPVGFATSSTRL